MLRTCLKCGQRNEVEAADDLAECPKCGAIYSRVEASVAHERAGPTTPKVPPFKPARGWSSWSRTKRWAAGVAGGYLVIAIVMAAMEPPAPTKLAPPRPASSNAQRQARVVERPAAPVSCSVDDAKCIGERAFSAAAGPCERAVEAGLAYRHEWSDAWYERKFDRVNWYQPTSTVIYLGNKLQAQNGFGAWKKLSYFCVWDVAGGRVVKSGIHE